MFHISRMIIHLPPSRRHISAYLPETTVLPFASSTAKVPVCQPRSPDVPVVEPLLRSERVIPAALDEAMSLFRNSRMAA